MGWWSWLYFIGLGRYFLSVEGNDLILLPVFGVDKTLVQCITVVDPARSHMLVSRSRKCKHAHNIEASIRRLRYLDIVPKMAIVTWETNPAYLLKLAGLDMLADVFVILEEDFVDLTNMTKDLYKVRDKVFKREIHSGRIDKNNVVVVLFDDRGHEFDMINRCGLGYTNTLSVQVEEFVGPKVRGHVSKTVDWVVNYAEKSWNDHVSAKGVVDGLRSSPLMPVRIEECPSHQMCTYALVHRELECDAVKQLKTQMKKTGIVNDDEYGDKNAFFFDRIHMASLCSGCPSKSAFVLYFHYAIAGSLNPFFDMPANEYSPNLMDARVEQPKTNYAVFMVKNKTLMPAYVEAVNALLQESQSVDQLSQLLETKFSRRSIAVKYARAAREYIPVWTLRTLPLTGTTSLSSATQFHS